MMIHSLKIDPEFLAPLLNGSKKFEVRYDDRDYRAGDLLCFARPSGIGSYYFVVWQMGGQGAQRGGWRGVSRSPAHTGKDRHAVLA